MDTDQTLYTNGEATDISTQLPDITSGITDMLAPFILLSLVISVIFIVFYVVAMIRRRKLENALFDIQKNLREMNEREKARTTSPSPLRTNNEKIAATETSDATLG